ncbi:MAG: hypothetical protein F4Z81_05695 [Gemmatimonadetes bacterium]|nr:hypothetical protein [Gemmatimonadota bacterium]MYB62075.1 hypothetical protein [Gemmatimonadota bacterium]
MERVNWPMVGIQAASTIVIIVVTLLTFTSQANRTLREEMSAEFTEIRTEFNALGSEFSALRTEVHDMNGRLGRVEGLLRLGALSDE